MNLVKDKNKLRVKVKELGELYSLDQKKKMSFDIFQQIEELEVFQKSKYIMVFWSLLDEVDTHDFIKKWCKQKTILLPVVNGDDLNVKIFCGVNNMQVLNKFNIHEPIGSNFEEMNKLDLVIVPGIAFDENNNRLGRGKGYYDRFLVKINTFKIGVCFNYQLFKDIPFGDSDVKMNNVVSSRPFIK